MGRFEPPKNHSFLVEVFEAVSRRTDAALLLIGDGSLRAKTEQEVKDKGLEDKALFLGVQDNIAQYLCAMDAFVFPSLFEGLGIVLIEAQANGLKCYVSESIP